MAESREVAEATARLGQLLRQVRRQRRLSRYRLARLLGLNIGTIIKLEAAGQPGAKPRAASPRVFLRVLRALLPAEKIEAALEERERPPDPYDLLGDQFPMPLFHHGPAEFQAEFRREFARDYAPGFFRLILGSGALRNLGARLRAFRLRHDLGQRDVARLLGLAPGHVGLLETGRHQAWPRVRYKVLRLVTLPLPPAPPRLTGGPPAERRAARAARERWLKQAEQWLAAAPPLPVEFAHDPDGLHRLRYLWLTTDVPTTQMAAELGIARNYLSQLLHGDGSPGPALRQRILRYVGAASLP